MIKTFGKPDSIVRPLINSNPNDKKLIDKYSKLLPEDFSGKQY